MSRSRRDRYQEEPVKKLALTILLVIAFAAIAGAQQTEIYVKTLYIERIYPTTLGYRVDYRRESSMLLATSYIPLDWFGGPGAKARVINDSSRNVPYVQVFYKDGEFSHLVLFVHPNIQHVSWGSIAFTEELEAQFNIEEPDFRY
jgi:hypothetical protein